MEGAGGGGVRFGSKKSDPWSESLRGEGVGEIATCGGTWEETWDPGRPKEEKWDIVNRKWSTVAGITSNDPCFKDTEKKGVSEFSRVQERNYLINANIMSTVILFSYQKIIVAVTKHLKNTRGREREFHDLSRRN